MSILSDLFFDLLDLISPPECLGCGRTIHGEGNWLCFKCLATIPSTEFHSERDNVMALKMRALCSSIENATAQYYYVKGGAWSNVIKHIKYRKWWYLAYKMGRRYGYELSESPLYQDIDFVVPVPLHFMRLLKRRYNQSELIATGIAKSMNIRVNRHSLRRTKHIQSQVSSEYEQRWDNVKGIFKLRGAKRFENKHILLVDDVYTTGATLSSCAEAIAAAAPTCRISIATLSITDKLMTES